MKKENVVIDIAGLLLDVKNHDRFFQRSTYEGFVKKNRDSYHFSANRSSWKNGSCPYFLKGSKFISYAYSQLLALSNGMLLHATAVVKDKKAFIFLGTAGSGKSTIAGLSKKYKVLGDDIIAVRKTDDCYYAFSTPWKQEPFIKPGSGSKGKIAAIFFIKKSDRISFKSLKSEDALSRILSSHIHFLIYTKGPLVNDIFITAADFARRTPAYEMEFEKNRDFWRELEERTRAARP